MGQQDFVTGFGFLMNWWGNGDTEGGRSLAVAEVQNLVSSAERLCAAGVMRKVAVVSAGLNQFHWIWEWQIVKREH